VSDPHFFVESLHAAGNRVTLTPEDSRHALRSLRLRPGNPVTLADGRGMTARGRVAAGANATAVAAEVEVLETARVDRPATTVSVALAPPKGERLSWAVQKLAELGVDDLTLYASEHSVRTWDAARADRALPRLRAIAREAAMQSRRPFILRVDGPVALEDVAGTPEDPAIVLWEGASDPLSVALEGAGGARLVVGPEGGFGGQDLGVLRAGGARLVTLGPGILRTETAAVVGAALALQRFGRLG
jgi:16S rRNA (uracil1498-N3)-methyltransferase